MLRNRSIAQLIRNAASVEITSPAPVAAKIMGTTIPTAVAGTYPTSENANAGDPTTKIGNPRICGYLRKRPARGHQTGRTSNPTSR
jgi:hypothetical protein